MTIQSTFRPVEIPVRQKATVDPLAIDGGPGADEIPEEHVEPATLGRKIATLLVILVPFAGLIAAVALLWGWAFDWVHLAILGVGYVLSGFGITVGYHRLFTHKSFETNKFVTAALGILGSMAWQGSLINWVQNHRCHHQHSDREDDPHSPHLHGEGFKAWLQGALFAHMGWFFTPDPVGMERYAPDLHASKLIRTISNLFPLWAALGVILPGLIALAIVGTWQSFVLGFLWGGLTRVFLLHHVTWSVNSVCHLWGSKTYRSHDESRNNAIFGILALGEGWHNNHHAFPASARHGLAWWQFDASYLFIRFLEKIGMAWNVRVPDRSRLEAKRIRATA